MTQVVFLGYQFEDDVKTVATMGQQAGPPGGDGWSLVAELPTSKLQASTHYAFWITGKIGNIRRTGNVPVTGQIQLCLGDASGVKHPVHLVRIGAADIVAEYEGIPFAFMVVFSASPTITDPVWGASWGNTANMQLFGRTFWNTDTPAYAIQFDVTDLRWIWFNLDDIPSNEQLATVTTLPSTLTSTPTFLDGSVNTPGSTGELWAHFWSIYYEPQSGTPAFEVGAADGLAGANFVAKHGNGARLGIGPRGGALSNPRIALGSFWCEQQTQSTYLTGVRGRYRIAGIASQPGQFQRFACVSIRLDNLPMVYHDHTDFAANLTDEFPTALFFGNRRFPAEIPEQDRTWFPLMLCTGQVEFIQTARRAFGLWTDLDNGQIAGYTVSHEQQQGPHEGVPCLTMGGNTIGPGSLAVQYRNRWLERLSPQFHHVRDVWFLTFYPVKDPDNAFPQVPTIGAPTAIIPGREGLSPGALPAPPFPPNFEVAEDAIGELEKLRGSTGYVRTWSVFQRVRRMFPLFWQPLTAAQRDTLVAFLEANIAMQVTPPHDDAIAAVRLSQPSWSQLSAQTFRVDVQVGELVFVTP